MFSITAFGEDGFEIRVYKIAMGGNFSVKLVFAK